MSRVPLKEAARGRWRDVLAALGVPAVFLNGKHQACPLCGGKDRARFDDKDGCGTYFCSQCGPGDGVMLVQKLRNVDFKGAAALIEPLLGNAERREPSVEFTDEQKRKWMRDLWEGGLPITAADPAGMWLAGRTGLDVSFR